MSSEKHLIDTFAEYLEKVEPVWSSYWEKQLNAVSTKSWDHDALLTYRKMTTGGKHLRACLTILGYELANKEVNDRILLASMSVEALHNAFLIHDDILDKSDTRRNEPTVHVTYEKKAIAAGFSAAVSHDVGFSTALNIGDVGQALAQQILFDSDFPLTALLPCIRLLNSHLWLTVMGQLQDMEHINIEELTEEYVDDIHKKKTAYYSFVLPILMGYTLGEGPKEYVANLTEYALKVGTVFQMQDDVLGIFGDEAELGKPVDTDVKEGKKTLLVCRTLQLLKGDLRKELLKSYGNSDISPAQVQRVGEIMRDCGALEYSNQKAARLIDEAIQAVQKLSISPEKSSILCDLAEYVGNRRF